jgi:hydrogenase/urease accessory protein HupE
MPGLLRCKALLHARWAALLLAVFCLPAIADEVRPAFLQITERGNAHYDVLWKQPTMGNIAVHLEPQISGGLLDRPPTEVDSASSFQIRRWRNLDAGEQGLEGRTLKIDGLEQTITDALVSVARLDGTSTQYILHPQNPSLVLHLSQRSPSAPEFLVHGIRHILGGPDHLLFVLALLLIVRDRRQLVKTVTAFTIAHSLTLAAATLGAIDLSTPLLNTLIALSILFVAPEVIRAARGGTSLTLRYPWVVAFAFGLLHGVGFATGLSPLGLPKATLLTALLLFNVGVEIGQLAFIALVLALMRGFRLMQMAWPRVMVHAPAYLIGTLGSFWTFQYGALLFGGT